MTYRIPYRIRSRATLTAVGCLLAGATFQAQGQVIVEDALIPGGCVDSVAVTPLESVVR